LNLRHAEERNITDYRMSLDYLTAQADWSDHFFGTKMDRSQIAVIQAMIEEIDRRGGLPASQIGGSSVLGRPPTRIS
jgi:hypothetical protein